MDSQNMIVLGHLARGLSLSQPEAASKYKIGRLAARVNDLRRRGHKIRTVMRQVRSGARIAFYVLEK